MNWINILGLSFGFIGTVLIVFYIRTDSKEWTENEEGQKPGEKWHALYVRHPRWVRVGVSFIALSFMLNIISEIFKCR